MTDDRVALFKAFDSASYLLYPPRVFMSHYVRQLDIDLFAPDALDDMQIGPAYTGTSNPNENFVIPF
jgi:hypothetical protein